MRGAGGMFPQENILKTNALRLILGHFLVHMHILANTYPCKIDVCCLIMSTLNGYFWGKMLLGGISQVFPPPCMNP